jgi:sugar lactone lactonase
MEEVATTILSRHHCLLGEGCTYDPVTDTAWWFDILERTLFRADLASGAVISHALPVMASVLARSIAFMAANWFGFMPA